jgi:nucleotide-binding universal stress UspA family protein
MTNAFVSILCPLELNDYSLSALDTAAAIARLAPNRNGILWLLHLLPLQVCLGSISDSSIGDNEAHKARRELNEQAAQRLKYLNYRVVIGQASHANRAAAVLETAAEVGADLIVMATHARRGLAHLMWGSVAEEVVRRATCPVLTVGPALARPREARRAVAFLNISGEPRDVRT